MKVSLKFISIIILLKLLSSFPTKATEVIELPLKNSEKIVVKMMFRNGSTSDPLGKEGLTSLTASLMMEGGTGNLTSTRIKELTYPWAASWGASTDKEVVVFTFEFHKDHKDVFFPIMTGLVTAPLLDENDFKRVKSNRQNFVNQVIRASSDEEFSKMALEDFLFRGTRYQHMAAGTSAGLDSIKLVDIKTHHRKYFSSQNLVIGIAGNYTEEFKRQIINAMNVLPPVASTQSRIQPNAVEPGINIEIISKKQAMGSAIFTGFPLPVTRRDDIFAALMVANSWLGEHRKSYSRLYQKIREQRSMNYGDYSYIEWYDNGGSNMMPQPGFPRNSNYFSIWIRPVQTAEALKSQYAELDAIGVGHAHFALRMALREMQLLIDNGMTKEDFELTRDFLRSYIKLYIQTPAKQLGFLMDSHFYGRKDYVSEMDALLAKLTLEDVNKVMRKFWQTHSMRICIVTDDSEAEPLKLSLLENRPSPMSYSKELQSTLPDAILNEDEEVAAYPLKINSVQIVESDRLFRK